MDSPPPSLGAVECRHFPPSFSTRRKEKKEEEKCLFCTSGVRAKGGPEFFFSLSLEKRERISIGSAAPLPVLLYYFTVLFFIYARYIPPPHHLNYTTTAWVYLPTPSTKHFLGLISSIFMRGGERQVEKERENGLL